MSANPVLLFRILEVPVRVECHDQELRALLLANFGQLTHPVKRTQLQYVVCRAETPPLFSITRAGQAPLTASEGGELLFLFEKDLTLELQRRRFGLYFLHAAALEWHGRVCLLVAQAGGGKSTTAWGLLHHGLRYMSDELSPINPTTMEVYPYPHALCLKHRPQGPYSLPERTIYTHRTLHVPVSAMSVASVLTPHPLASVFFLKYSPDRIAPTVCSLGKATAAAHLYANTLNALAHTNSGLDIAARIASAVPSFWVEAGELQATCSLIMTALAQSHH